MTRSVLATLMVCSAALAFGTHSPLAVAAPSPAQVQAAAVRQVSSAVADAGEPSISANGRWIVFSGLAGDRRSVFRTDRTNNVTIELSPVPDGVRAGETIHPRLSADGCVVAAITEIPFDLFRDDDQDDRWDVYRLVVPECDGQPNGWELVSGVDRTGIARDDVFTDSAPAVTGSGAEIAYVHQAPGAPDGVATISIVDVTVPINGGRPRPAGRRDAGRGAGRAPSSTAAPATR